MRRLLIGIIRVYQGYISPYLNGCCRFYPSCSNYAVEALEVHGFIKGSMLGVWRILRCNPFNRGGVDFIPNE